MRERREPSRMQSKLRWLRLPAGRFSAPLGAWSRPAALGVCVALAACAVGLVSGPASADAGIALSGGPTFALNGDTRNAVGSVQTNLGLGYDIGPKIVVPVRVSLDIDYAGGSGNGGTVSEFGGGLGARLTTPLYLGLTASLYNVNIHPGAVPLPGSGGGLSPSPASATGFGTNFFVGERIFGLPGGAGVALQATYRRLPPAGGYDPSSLTVGLRASF
jgi:hypothetical protein